MIRHVEASHQLAQSDAPTLSISSLGNVKVHLESATRNDHVAASDHSRYAVHVTHEGT